jgi:cytochrome c5
MDQPSARIFPLYLVWFVAGGLLVLLVGALLFWMPGRTSGAMSAEAIADRLAPVAGVEFAAAAGSAHALRAGEAVYSGLCAACHGVGVAGAPKAGDKNAWGPRIAQGFDVLVKHATEGYKGMPAKGGSADLDPQEVARAVAWLADQAGAKFKEP